MVNETIKQTIGSVTAKVKFGNRSEVLDMYIRVMSDAIKELKKKATTLDLHRISWLYHAMHEVRLCKELDQAGVAQRIKDLNMIVRDAQYDDDERALALASLTVITEAGKNIRRTA